MNILMVHPHDVFHSSEPWTIRIKAIAGNFAKKGHRVKVCYFPMVINEKHALRKIGGVEFIPLDRMPSPRSFVRNTRKLTGLSRWADVVHLQKCHHYASIPTVIAAYIAGKPFHYDWDDWEEKIWYESCGNAVHSHFIGASFKVLERWLPVLADSISCASGRLKELARGFGIKDEYIFDSPVGADIDKFRPGLRGGRVREKYNITGELVLYIGQLHGAQYVDLFIRAANIVVHERPGAVFMIVGEGFLEHGLKRLTSDLGLDDSVIFTGSVPHDEIPHYIASATVCVAPFEDTEVTRCKSPLKIVEYLASGKPIVASNIGEVRKMAGGVSVLVRPGDHMELAEKVSLLLRDRELRENLAVFARRRAENKYNWDFTSNSIMSAYNKVLR